MSELGLEDRLLTTSKKSLAAQNRFVYYPDHLVRMPSAGDSRMGILRSLISEPVFSGILGSISREWRQPSRPADLLDESVGSFLSRRLGSPTVANNLVSAIFHGIYAGNIYQLSARSLLPYLWQYEGHYGSITKTMLQATIKGLALRSEEDVALMTQKSSISTVNQSVFTFLGGIETLAETIVTTLKKNPNVEIRTETHVKEVKLEKNEAKSKVCFSPVKSNDPRQGHTLPPSPRLTSIR